MKEIFADTPEKLRQLCDHLKDVQVIALDTEFLREKTYFAQLCLIQVATDEVIACIDPIAIDDISPFLTILYNSDITKIMHAARQDLEIFFDITAEVPQPIFDTQIAATLLGLGDQIGYAALVEKMLDVKLAKSHTRTNWSRRPLEAGQIEYALDDVRYLLEMYQRQYHELQQKDRLHWLDNDFNALTDVQTYQITPNNLWQKVRGATVLKGVRLAVLQQLAMWREQRARQANRPRRWVLRDDLLVEVARQMPENAAALSNIRGCDAFLQKHADNVLSLIAEAKALPKEQWPQAGKHLRLTLQQEAKVDLLMAVVRILAVANHVTPSVLASRKDLECLVLDKNHCAALQGWRAELVGNELIAVLKGEKRVAIDNGELCLESTAVPKEMT